MPRCLVCNTHIELDTDNNQICDECEGVRDETTNGKGDDEDE